MFTVQISLYRYLKRWPQERSTVKQGCRSRLSIRGACACFSFELSIWWLFDRDTQRRACILPGSLATSCPSALGRGQGDTGHTHLPLNPPTVASAEKQSLSLRRSHRSTHLLWQEKHLWHLESSLYVWLCVGAAVRAWSGWRDAGKSSMSSPLSPPSPPRSPFKLFILWESLLYMFTWKFACRSCTRIEDGDLLIWPQPDNRNTFVWNFLIKTCSESCDKLKTRIRI